MVIFPHGNIGRNKNDKRCTYVFNLLPSVFYIYEGNTQMIIVDLILGIILAFFAIVIFILLLPIAIIGYALLGLYKISEYGKNIRIKGGNLFRP